MRMTRLLANTLRDNPAEAEVVSHQLLVRGGFIRRVASGIYNQLPLMWRVTRKVENIIREEMNKAGAQELMMPILQPADLWKESGRWEVYGKELMRLTDRHERDCVLAPTHEEVITAIARTELQSYRSLPVNLYQIQNKYRDEIRPRFGLLRGREFLMKDAYSFHANDTCLDKEYDVMTQAYNDIFNRCGIETVMVRSDSGAIGGSVSHEFMLLTRIAEGEQESGENEVYFCDGDNCHYAANGDRAEAIIDGLTDGTDLFPSEAEVETPNCKKIEQLCETLNCPPSLICKALLYIVDEETPLLVLIRGDLEAEETKLANVTGASELRLATDDEIWKFTKTKKGSLGTANLPMNNSASDDTIVFDFGENASPSIRTVIDNSVMNLTNFVIAFNKPHYHLTGYNWTWDSTDSSLKNTIHEIRKARMGDTCPECKTGALQMTRGIEVGNIFKLGTKYSEAMNAKFTDENGEDKPFIMGCYGIGVTRTAAATVERYHDKFGIIWPMAIAPYHAVIIPVNTQVPEQMALAQQLYEEFEKAGIEVVMDDRDERAGVKFKDADLIGFPIRITAGKKAGEGVLECKMRDQKDAIDLPVADVLPWARKQMQEWRPFQEGAKTPVEV